LPQLAASTFPSQIFWVLVGFASVYFLVSTIFMPKMEKILGERKDYVDDLLQTARRLKSESENLNRDASEALESARTDFAKKEYELTTAFRQQSSKEKELLHNLFSEKSKTEAELLTRSSDEVFREISEKTDEMAEAALAYLFRLKRPEKKS
jgi:F-type H+-transporting ATPase subunit b